MPKPLPYTFAVSRARIDGIRVDGFLDMLRYDAARVVERDDRVVVLRADREPTHARWQSFGLPVLHCERGDGPNVRVMATRTLKREESPE